MIAWLQQRLPKAPLHVHVGALFVTLVLGVGGLMAYAQYHNTSRIIVDSSDQLIDLMARHIQADLRYRQNGVAAVLNQARLHPIVHATDWQQRAAHLQWVLQLLQDHDTISTFILGYPDGDAMLARPVRTLQQRLFYHAPPNTFMVLDYVDRNPGKDEIAERYFYDHDLKLLAQTPSPDVDFDPRQRPWYQQAVNRHQIEFTRPYPFYSTGDIGITMARSAGDGVVVAADFSLETLTSLLHSFTLPARSQIVLFDQAGEVIGYPDAAKLRAHTTVTGVRPPQLNELDVPVLRHFADVLTQQVGIREMPFDGEAWFSQVQDVSVVKSLPLKLAILIPEKALLARALSLRDDSLLATLVILLLAIPLSWFLSRLVAIPLRQLEHATGAIRGFHFDQPVGQRSFVMEIDSLSQSIRLMNGTIQHFLQLIEALSREKRLDSLVATVAEQTRVAAGADASLLLLLTEDKRRLQPCALSQNDHAQTLEGLTSTVDASDAQLKPALQHRITREWPLNASRQLDGLCLQLLKLPADTRGQVVVVPLVNREGRVLGALSLLYWEKQSGDVSQRDIHSRLGFIHTVSGFAAVSVETQQLINHQKKLFTSFIELIAGAIDAKSPYTGGHCQRVPVITEMLAQAACESREPPFEHFDLDEDEWEALHMAGWLHDCGKVTTPEQVVDKATKLEARYDRIHEIRMRFEVLKVSAECDYWRARAQGEASPALEAELHHLLRALDQEFAFVAGCNLGSEFLSEPDKVRLKQIGQRQWKRTLSDRMGISWEEENRKRLVPEPVLPTWEPLLSDRLDHLIPRDNQPLATQPNLRFNLVPPPSKYNLGELYNLTISRGTLTDEERFLINDHIVQTIIMLNCLPYPEHLKAVPAIAGGHHEKMDGTGYPLGLKGKDMPLTARMMAIADIFEALTAADRPYKAAKTLSESLAIMSTMVKEHHIDPDLFRLFVESGVYRVYAERYLTKEQIDVVDEAALMSA